MPKERASFRPHHKQLPNIPINISTHRSLMSAYHQSDQHIEPLTCSQKELQILRENYKFLLDDEDFVDNRWEMKIVKKYHDNLFKEYCMTNLKHFKSDNIPMRWRTEAEVIQGKGQFTCGNIRCLHSSTQNLSTWEVNFGYQDENSRKKESEKKNALVKLVLCLPCSDKLDYSYQRKKAKGCKEEKEKDQAQQELSETIPQI